MIIPFPERVSLFHAALFAFLLTIGLVASGTGVLFSGLVFAFVVVAAIGFNVGGGITRPSGSYIFFFSTLAVIVGLCVKVAIWEPTEMYLLSPLTTMSMYLGGITSMMGAAYLARRFARSEGLLQDVCSTKDMRLAAIGCVVFGFFMPMIAQIIVETTTNPLLLPIANASSQLDRFLPMAVILGVTYEIKSSGGKRSTNLWVWLAIFTMMFNGFLLNFSKEALYTPTVCWLLAASALRYRFRPAQVIGIALFGFFSFYYFVPYCQYGRNFRGESQTSAEKFEVALPLLMNLNDVREKNRLADEALDRQGGNIFIFYSKPMGLFDRLQMIGIDDKLVTVTDQKGPYGLSPIAFYFASMVPKIIWKNKPFIIMGNTFSHEIGFNEDDMTTGISFSPVVEGYHEAKWFGIFVVCPLVWFGGFLILDTLCGDVRKSPWGLLVTALCAHIAPEGLLQGLFYVATYGAFAIVVVAFISAYLMPMLGHFVSPPKKQIHVVPAAGPVPRPAFVNARPARTQL